MMNTKKTLNPSRRFPIYHNEKGWKNYKLNDIITVVNDKCSVANLCIETYISTENILPNYGGIKIASKLPTTGTFTRFKKGDVLFSNIRPYLKKVWWANFDGVASNDIIVFRALTGFDACFISHIIKNDAFITYSMKGAKGVKMPRGDKDMMLQYEVYVPNIEEQKEIAECLSSIDSYRSSINEKVEQLKAHKKSLLQKLFPQRGQTVPEYRFPEFKTDEDWITNKVGESFKLQGGFAFKSNKFIATGIPVIRISNIPSDSLVVNLQNCVFYEELPNMHNYTANDGDLLIAMSGATTGKTAIYRGKKPVYVNQRVGIFKLVDNSIYYPFICQWIRTDHFANQIKKMLAAGAQPNISSNDIESLLWQHPQNMKEQMKIASCLSTIDDLIDAYKNKLIYIEDYQKGLIQQLFPINS